MPRELIAQEPLEKRSSSRLLVLDRITGEISHKGFFDILKLLRKGDCLVINDSKVIPARLLGVKETGAAVELLLLKSLSADLWEALVKPGRRIKKGDALIFGDGKLKAFIEDNLSDGIRIVKLEYSGIFDEVIERLGDMPLPPYITKKLLDKSRYQTVYAKNQGSAAAPTAGLHFTNELLSSIQYKDVKIAKVTLHVGLGTFRPIKTQNILDHEMHSERFSIDVENARLINETRRNGGRIICVGTTSVRCLETASDSKGILLPLNGSTNIFIYPGYNFKITDGLITNFHLPESTLMALVSAFAGTDNVLRAYKDAVLNKYRFFSFGDAMVIL